MREFIHETQQSVTVGQQLTMVWWIPAEFWDISLADNPNVPAGRPPRKYAAFFTTTRSLPLLRANDGPARPDRRGHRKRT